MKITDLVNKYHKNRESYIKQSYNESQLRNDFLDPFFELLGWDIKNAAGKSTYEREVLVEEALKSNVNENTKKPDYTFRLFSQRKFFVEAKKPFVKIETDAIAAKQIRRYGFTAKLKISILSNFEYLAIYDTSVLVHHDDNHHVALIKIYHYSEYEANFDKICFLIGKASVYDGNFDSTWLSIEEKINQYSIDTLFLTQINQWRILLGQEIYNSHRNISPIELNDIVQSYLNRIIFLRVCEDREIETYQTLLKLADDSDYTSLILKFKQADKKYNSGLFDQLLSDKIIENVSSVFWAIIKQLYYPQSAYSFTVFSSDILGSIYEIFLSQKLSFQGGNIGLIKKPEHIDKDVVTTPTFIISEILRLAVLERCKKLSPSEILRMKFADIACGSGAFLLELFQLLNDIFIDYYLKNDKRQLIQTGTESYKLPFGIKLDILLNCIYGVDKDFNAVEAAKFGLLLKVLENEDPSTISTFSPVLPDLSNNFFFGNSLIDSTKLSSHNENERINPFDFPDLLFDVIVGNPPYMKSEDMKNITPLELPLYKLNYVSAYKQFDKYFLFIERGLSLLKENGVLCYIIPSKFIKVGSGIKLRQLLSSNGYLNTYITFGANQLFNDKTTYTCIMKLENNTKPTYNYCEVNDLEKWKIRDATSFHYDIKNISDVNDEVWELVPNKLQSTYNKILDQSIKLKDLIGREGIFNGIQTSANKIYVFTPIDEDSKFYYFEKKGNTYRIEKSITKPYFQTSSGEDNLYTYRSFKPNARVIFPYFFKDNKPELISLEDISENFPEAYSYLIRNRTELSKPSRDIKPTPSTQNEWHRYGRHQSLEISSISQKLIVGVLSQGNKYAVDNFGTLISSGGTAGYCGLVLPSDCPYNIYYVQAILNSKYVEWFSAILGEVFRGGYIARGTKVLNNLPIREIDFQNKNDALLHDSIVKLQIELIHCHDEIDNKSYNKRALIPLTRTFSALQNQMDSLLFDLFDLGSEDVLVPLIKEMYK
jgi:hypothetical protein